MTIKTIERNGVQIAAVETDEILITDTQSALDLMASVRYGTDIDRLIVPKTALDEKFFILSSGLAGEVLQKFTNYGMKFAVWGDFSGYTSKPLRDFIYESNNGSSVFFAADEQDAAERLAKAK